MQEAMANTRERCLEIQQHDPSSRPAQREPLSSGVDIDDVRCHAPAGKEPLLSLRDPPVKVRFPLYPHRVSHQSVICIHNQQWSDVPWSIVVAEQWVDARNFFLEEKSYCPYLKMSPFSSQAFLTVTASESVVLRQQGSLLQDHVSCGVAS